MTLIQKTIRLIPNSHHREGKWLLAGLFLGSTLDLISLASLFPLLLLLVDTEDALMNSIPFTIQVSRAGLAIGIGIAFLLLTVIKAGYHQWIIQKKAAYAYRVGGSIAETLLRHFFAMDYQRYSGKDYSQEMNRLSNLPLVFANNIIMPIGTLITELVIFLLLLIAITIFDYLALVMVIGVALPTLWLYSLRKEGIKQTSEQIKNDYPRLLKSSLQAVEGWRDIKVFHREGYFVNHFLGHFKKLGEVFSRDHALHTSTSRLAEIVAALCITVLIVYAFVFSGSIRETVLLFGVYAAVSFRAIPSVSRILGAYHQIQSHEYVVQQLDESMIPSPKAVPEGRISFSHHFGASSLCFSYDDAYVINDLSFKIDKGALILIQGKSGAGKTTLALLLSGMLAPSKGSVRVDGMELKHSNMAAWTRMVAYIPQEPFLLDATIEENIAFGVEQSHINQVKIDRILGSLDLMDWVNQLPDKKRTVIGERGIKVSGGQRQRLVIARALYHKTSVLFLDEITNQLDPKAQAEVVDLLKSLTESGITIVMISHQMTHKSKFDGVFELRQGKLIKSELAPQP